MRARRVGTLAAFVVLAACSGSDEPGQGESGSVPAGDTTTTTVAAVPQGAEEPYVTEVESCTSRPPAAPLASGTLTNNTDESSSYDIWVDFTDASGAVVATGMSSADSVDPGETVSWEAVSIDLGAVATGCDVSRVEPW